MLTVTWGVTPLCGVTLNFFSQTVDLQRLRTRTLYPGAVNWVLFFTLVARR
jgi:hypothetical protein